MGRNLEDQMRLSMRGILSKQMTGGGAKNQVIASFVSDDEGFPLTGMKRSEINKYQKDAVSFLNKHNFLLPAWAFWTSEEWRQKTGSDYDVQRQI